ncbi:myelin-associated glycoprotein isoform X2 [Scleropages formosus]|uniref:Myelin-associated glycoprotein-like n=1 Tax=Scleropages formosus TaxID=113540 RepID=A0A8C9S8Y0_SCLFO|nr:myelin-associated glycoprotein-like isoform X2 [Scleropages formosus]
MGLAGVLFVTVVFGLMKEVLLSSITISIPEQVSALSGSCVVIPCSFTVQPPRIARGKPVKYHIRLRYPYGLFSRWRTAFSNEDTTEVERSFRGRTSLTGDPSKGDCSVRIDRVRKEDANQYEVALKERGASEWKTTISVSVSVSDTPVRPVISDPGTITEGQLVTLNCTVIYSCPGQPPQLRWRWEKGGQENSSQYQEQVPPQPHQQKLVLHTSVSFHASHLAPPRIKCLAGYGDKWTASATKELHIRFPPKDIAVNVLTVTVQEGASALLYCACKADPPVTEYQWSYTRQDHTIILASRVQNVRVHNVTRDMIFYCRAQNEIGGAESGPAVVNVQYKPLISETSSCQWDGWTILCQCVVDSNPRPAVTWSVNGSNPPDSYNTSVSATGGTVAARLNGGTGQQPNVVCYAHNALGNDSATLLAGSKDSLLWKVVPASAILVSLFLFASILFLLHCRRKTGKHMLKYRHPSVYPGNLGVYHYHSPIYINCSEVTHIYTNGSYQLVYQNCTPIFVQNKQWRHQRERRVVWSDGPPREIQTPGNDPENAIYLEVI